MSESPHDLLSKTESLDQSASYEITLLRMSVDPNPNPKKEEEEEDPKLKLQIKLSDSIFHQHIDLMALLDHTFFCL